jgi:hypothetical protein
MTPKPTQESRTLHLLKCKGAAHPNPVPLRVGVRMDARLQHRVIAGSNAGREQPGSNAIDSACAHTAVHTLHWSATGCSTSAGCQPTRMHTAVVQHPTSINAECAYEPRCCKVASTA